MPWSITDEQRQKSVSSLQHSQALQRVKPKQLTLHCCLTYLLS